MKNILLQVNTDSIISDTLKKTDIIISNNLENAGSTSFSIWFWITIIEFIIILFLLLKLKNNKNKLEFGGLSKSKMRQAKDSNINMDDLMDSINGSKGLYKELSRTCHPDRFINSDKQEIAKEIFQQISKHQRDFQKLTQLKDRAIAELNINFK